MRFNVPTLFVVALFALFSALAFAAPVVPAGEMGKRVCVFSGRQLSEMMGLGSSNQGDPIAMIIAIQVLLNRLKGMVNGPHNLSAHLFGPDDSGVLVSQQRFSTSPI